jgi:hypothetical protein
MGDANLQQNVLMHLIGEHPAAAASASLTATNSAMAGGSAASAVGRISARLAGNRLLTYQRITVELTRQRLDQLGLSDVDPGKVGKLDCVDQMDNLQKIGRIAKEQVNMQSLRKCFLADSQHKSQDA